MEALADVSDAVWNTLIAAGLAAVLAWINRKSVKAVNGKLDVVAEKVQEVAIVTRAKLKLEAETLRARAKVTRLSVDKAAAKIAEAILKQHDLDNEPKA